MAESAFLWEKREGEEEHEKQAVVNEEATIKGQQGREQKNKKRNPRKEND